MTGRRAMDGDQMYAAITAQRLRLADRLDTLTPDEWDADSLCTGWRMREVVAHLVGILEIPVAAYTWGIVKARNFDKYNDQIARRIGARDPAALAGSFRALASKRFAPPVIGPIAPMADVYVHTRDIERPLDRAAHLDPTPLAEILDYVCSARARGFVPGRRTKGLRFEASDLDWSHGDGPVVTGAGEALMMAVCGRGVALSELTGDGVEVLRSRL
jgi:uncharacterized protein (TIGR03083 family)